ncbi:MAG: hypothetical protein KW793_03830 [Candidatus Doudnabacteria bacterium]|nr:hypothetical protein [Candidatus Doudnabacteria bacterium]
MESSTDKGQYMGECNRTACTDTPAEYYNHSTRMYYCETCARSINYHNRADAMRMFGHDLCTLGESQDKQNS